jgi:ketosteroid isomerase-like protein
MLNAASIRRSAAVIAASLLLATGTVGSAEENPRVAAEIIALAKAQWAAEIARKPVSEQLASVADDYSEFNPVYPTRIDSKILAMRMVEADPGDATLLAEMQNPRVQVYGDTAILTYNYAGINRDKDGKTNPQTAKSTRVYVREGGKWMLVHANFAPVQSADD